jgi:hypothetical protein
MTKVINSTKEKAALLDWDGTLRAGYEITEWCDFLDERGNFDREIGKRQRTLLSNYLTGKITYSQAVFDVGVNYAEGLEGYKVKDTQDLALQFAENDKAIFDFTPALFEILHRNKIKIILVSNTPRLLLEVYSQLYLIPPSIKYVFLLSMTNIIRISLWAVARTAFL